MRCKLKRKAVDKSILSYIIYIVNRIKVAARFLHAVFLRVRYFMRKIVNKKILLVLFITAVAALALGIFRTYLLFNFVEPETGFYVRDNNFGFHFDIAAVVICVFMIAGAWSLKKVKAPLELKSESTMVVFASSLCGFMFVTVLGYGLYKLFNSQSVSAFLVVELFLCVPCMINFFSICAKEQRLRNATQTLLSLFPALFFAVRIIERFTDVTTQINVSQRSLTLIMLCSAMMFFVCETRFFLPLPSQEMADSDKTKTHNVVKYFASGLFTVSFVIMTVLPYLVVCSFWVFSSDFLLMDILDGCIGLYALTRLVSLVRN